MKCKPPKVGYFEPTEKPLGPGGRSNPWRWFYSAISVEAILFLGLLAYVIKPRQREEKENYVYCNCPHCKWRLRFRDSLLGKGGQCPRCKRLFRFPEMEEADQEEHPETEEQPAHR